MAPTLNVDAISAIFQHEKEKPGKKTVKKLLLHAHLAKK
jgi:hypothetical protein